MNDRPKDPAAIMESMAATFRERNAVYGNNFRNVGGAMKALYPNGLHLLDAEDHELFHLFSLIIVKLSRYANSGLLHKDSIHDVGVYAAMMESIVEEREVAAADEILSTAMDNDARHEAVDGDEDGPFASDWPGSGSGAEDGMARVVAGEPLSVREAFEAHQLRMGVHDEAHTALERYRREQAAREAFEAQQSRLSVHDDAHIECPGLKPNHGVSNW